MRFLHILNIICVVMLAWLICDYIGDPSAAHAKAIVVTSASLFVCFISLLMAMAADFLGRK